jgi:hypothetical protein
MITKQTLKRYIKQKYDCKYKRKQSLETWLVKYLCNLFGYEIESHLKDIATHGCISGCINNLIYNTDIVSFYQKYESQIWEMVYEYTQNTGQTIGQFLDGFKYKIEDEINLKVSLSWFAVEILAYQFLDQFNINY